MKVTAEVEGLDDLMLSGQLYAIKNAPQNLVFHCRITKDKDTGNLTLKLVHNPDFTPTLHQTLE